MLPSAEYAQSKLGCVVALDSRENDEKIARERIVNAYKAGVEQFAVFHDVPGSVRQEMIELGWYVYAHNDEEKSVIFSLPSAKSFTTLPTPLKQERVDVLSKLVENLREEEEIQIMINSEVSKSMCDEMKALGWTVRVIPFLSNGVLNTKTVFFRAHKS